MAKQRGMPSNFSLDVDDDEAFGDVDDLPVDLGDYLDEDELIAAPVKEASPTVGKIPTPPPLPEQSIAESAATDLTLPTQAVPTEESAAPQLSVVPPKAATTEVAAGTVPKKTAPVRRKQINMSATTLNMIEGLVEHVRKYSPEKDARASELIEALLTVAFEAKDDMELSTVPRRGAWGSPTAKAFKDGLKKEWAKAISDRYRKLRTESDM